MIELGVGYLFNYSYNYLLYIFISLLIFFNIIPLITRGKTIGYCITNIVVKDKSGEDVKKYKLFFRNIIFSYIYIPMHYYLYLLFKLVNSVAKKNYSSLVVIGYISIIIISSIFIIVRNFILHKPFLYEIITKTKVFSTIEDPENKNSLK